MQLRKQRLLEPVQRCGPDMHAGCPCRDDDVAAHNEPGVLAAQRQGPFGAARAEFNQTLHKATFDTIQAAPMYDLLPKLQALPDDVPMRSTRHGRLSRSPWRMRSIGFLSTSCNPTRKQKTPRCTRRSPESSAAKTRPRP